MVTFEQFTSLNLIVARILKAEDHPNADKLYLLTIDVGQEEPRTIVAGIKASYTPEELIGRLIIVVENLEPAVIRGVESKGMLLAAKGETGPRILTPDRDITPGTRIS